jgi:type VI protein secretion system component VasF
MFWRTDLHTDIQQMKTLTLALTLALACAPAVRPKAQQKRPEWVGLACGVIVLVGGAILTWELYKYCQKHLKDPAPDNPPGTNNVNHADTT